MPISSTRCGIESCGAHTALGDERETASALVEGQNALKQTPVLAAKGGDAVPLALANDWNEQEGEIPRWKPLLRGFAARVPGEGWGGARRPVFLTGSNFGIDSVYAFRQDGDPRRKEFLSPHLLVTYLREQANWGPNITVFSHACVSAGLGLRQAARLLANGSAEKALVFSFDFVSPFVAGGFHALKILNGLMPAPFSERAEGSVGLGDGLAFAVLSPKDADFNLSGFAAYNEMHHFTANDPNGRGFDEALRPIAEASKGRKVWVKGHGTGTLQAGKLEADAVGKHFAGAPLVSWKGSLGHTLGSCALVELVLAAEMIKNGRAAGTIGASRPTFSEAVALAPFSTRDFDAVAICSNAFGGAHANCLMSHG